MQQKKIGDSIEALLSFGAADFNKSHHCCESFSSDISPSFVVKNYQPS